MFKVIEAPFLVKSYGIAMWLVQMEMVWLLSGK